MDATPEPDWLTEDEQAAWLALASVMIRLPAALDGQLRRDAGLTHFEYSVLAALSERPHRTIRLSELAALADGSLSRLSQVVSRLERRGLVRRTPDAEDRRATLAVLTDEGWDTIVATAPSHVAEVRRLVFDHLTRAQVGQLRGIGERINRAIDCAGDDGPRRAAD